MEIILLLKMYLYDKSPGMSSQTMKNLDLFWKLILKSGAVSQHVLQNICLIGPFLFCFIYVVLWKYNEQSVDASPWEFCQGSIDATVPGDDPQIFQSTQKKYFLFINIGSN